MSVVGEEERREAEGAGDNLFPKRLGSRGLNALSMLESADPQSQA